MAAEVTHFIGFEQSMRMRCSPPDTEDYAGVLDSSIGIEKLRAHCAHIGAHRLMGHDLQPSRVGDLDIVVEKAQEVARCFAHGTIVERGKIERAVVCEDAGEVRGKTGEVAQGFWLIAPVVDHNDFLAARIVGGCDTFEAGAQKIDLVAGRHDDAHAWKAAALFGCELQRAGPLRFGPPVPVIQDLAQVHRLTPTFGYLPGKTGGPVIGEWGGGVGFRQVYQRGASEIVKIAV